MFHLGWPELTLVVVVALLLFGAKRVPEVARALGLSINAFKGGLKDGQKDADGGKAEMKKPPEEPKA